MIENPLISVCVCTFHRPVFLTNLLSSLAKQPMRPTEFEVIIIDNDKEGSAQPVIELAIKSWPHLIIKYDIEPRPGISYPRNRSVAMARGRYLAFIDDDEVACENWLPDLLATIESSDAHAVLGPVLPVFPDGSKTWAISSGFFERPRFKNGIEVDQKEGRTGNALIRSSSIKSRHPEIFSTKFALLGGEDSDFFEWLAGQGGRIVWCDTAVVHEEVPLARQTLSFILERSFRSSVTYWNNKYATHNLFWNIFKAGQGFFGGLVCFSASIAFFLFKGLAFSLPMLCRGTRAFGRVGALFRLNLAGYGFKKND